MIRLDDLTCFVRSAALGSFSNAARELNVLPAQVSAAILRLERALDVRLFARSTRSLRLTDEGERYLPHAQDALAALQGGQDSLRAGGGELSGTLRISAPSDLGRNLLLPWISAFRRQHPRLDLRLLLSDQVQDVFREPIDAALRYGLIDDASYIALPLAPDNRRVLVAAPDYIARHGAPAALDELAGHACLRFQLGGRVYEKWAFPTPDGLRQIQVGGPLVTDDADVVRRWAVAGEGIAYKSWLDVGADVQAGRLHVLLPDQPGEAAPLNLICPHRKQFSAAVRQLHEQLSLHCRTLKYSSS